jgi:hypothetical protein
MKLAAVVAICFLSLIALGHAARLVLRVDVTVGSLAIPMWPSVLAAVGPAALAVWLWREQKP